MRFVTLTLLSLTAPALARAAVPVEGKARVGTKVLDMSGVFPSIDGSYLLPFLVLHTPAGDIEFDADVVEGTPADFVLELAHPNYQGTYDCSKAGTLILCDGSLKGLRANPVPMRMRLNVIE